MFFQQLVNGISIGSIYALIAVGYSLIYSLLSFTNFAHAIAVTAGAYTGFYMLTKVSSNIILALLVATATGALVSSLIEVAAYRPLLNKKAKRIYLLIAGLGITTIGENAVIIALGGRFKAYPVTFSIQPINFLGTNLSSVDFVIFVASVIMLILVEIIIQKSKIGLAIRGASFSLETTSLMGVNVKQLIFLVFFIAGTLAGFAGFFLGIKYTAYPALGQLTTKAFISAVFGGLGSIPGAVIGAMLLGIFEALISAYISSSMRDMFSFSLLIIILLVRPTGLMGKRMEDKA